MPWAPELFSGPALQQVLDRRQRTSLVSMPYFDGLAAGEPDTLVASFAGEPDVDDPIRGRITGERAFRAYAAEMAAWLAERNVTVEDVAHVILEPRGFEEVVLHADGEHGRIELPFIVVADHVGDRVGAMRLYYRPDGLTGAHERRPAILHAGAELSGPDVVTAYRRALADGAVDELVALFGRHGSVRTSSGDLHRGSDALRAFFDGLLADGGLDVETCGVVDDGHLCALELNVVRRGGTPVPAQPGVAVHVRGRHGRLAAVRLY